MGRFALGAVLLSTAVLASPALANSDLIKLHDDPNNWASQSGSYNAHRYSKLDQINTKNVGDLKVAWTFSTGVLRGHEGSPLVIGDVMYLHTPFPNIVFALDLNDENKIIWRYEPKQDPSVIGVMCCDTVNRGLSYADGKIILQQADTTIVALDAKTGKEIWKATNGDPKIGETSTNTFLIAKDKVIAAISGAEFGVRGRATAYDLNTGKLVWRAYSVGPDEEIMFDPEKTMSLGKPVGKNSSLNTWTGDQWKIGGGTMWGGWSYDPDADLAYYGTANPSTWNPAQRASPEGKPIDQKWTMSIIARNPDTGMAAWAYQMTPFDEWDYDGVNENILADLDIGGKKTPALVHFDRNGFAYTLNRHTGELLVAEKYDPAVNWATKVEMDKSSPRYGRPEVVSKYSTFANGPDVNTKGICPAALGSKDMQPASYSQLTGLFYVPTNHVCMDYEPFQVQYTAGQPYVGATLSMYPAPGKGNMGNFIAWDASKGKIVWSMPEQFSVWSGALTTAGGVVFYGTLEGYFKALDQKTGKELFRSKTPSGIIGNAFTYSHKGTQYVGVFSGVGGWAGIGLAAGLTNPTDGLGAVGGYAGLKSYTNLGGTLTVFALPNKQ
ncbi:MAG: methanol/ethanol family PQQ-dependent dehydrogenase [Hyphomicrobium sp.]|uniref:methanol/ethanol family PQQ-dependent dehydrogenase n=1 Tax=Hyphomicrobium sp. TaxID=82 RepID=UPI001324B7E3|nr:methanol/ethanol family PQQ-dependent dehydrogenase [Hyphomicrobium sp.]KAB2940672.1 MAG: PQQ-dependent dehydrogenase, methanol/ethanol family [Hyphomicrobium sp.]MBZ0211559.1 methanol/ethanol family PQQ-dependent dehydrogenase [Hyphomicrobium sp.]